MSRVTVRWTILTAACGAFIVVLGARATAEHLRRAAGDELWQKQVEEARSLYQLATRFDPLDLDAVVGTADSLMEEADQPWLGTPDQVETLERAIALYMKVLRVRPSDSTVWAQLARTYQSLAVARRAAQPLDISSLTAEPTFDLPEDRMAVASMMRALELEPNNHIYLDYLAELRYGQGHPDGLDWYRRGTRVLPRLNRHSYLERPGLPPEVARAAVAGAREALGTDNAVVDSKILEEISLYEARWGNHLQAADVCIEAIEAGHPKPAIVWSRRGLWLDHAGRTEDARDAFTRALAADPGYATAHYGLGRILAREGDLDAAIRSLREARDLQPRLRRYQRELAAALDRAGRLADATREYRQLLRLKTDDLSTLSALVDLYRRQKILDQALVHAKRLVELHPDEEAFQRQVQELEARLTF